MEVSSISPEGISVLKQAQVQTEANVKVQKNLNEQQKAVAETLVEAIKEKTPEPGKGLRVNTIG